jgi:hypothetical protein
MPWVMWGAAYEMRRKRAGWFELLAAFMSSQPASCQIHFFRIWSSVLPAALALSPWITGLNIAMAQEDDFGKVLKGTIQVGRCHALLPDTVCPPCVLKQEVGEPPHVPAHSSQLIPYPSTIM